MLARGSAGPPLPVLARDILARFVLSWTIPARVALGADIGGARPSKKTPKPSMLLPLVRALGLQKHSKSIVFSNIYNKNHPKVLCFIDFVDLGLDPKKAPPEFM